jgi:hypothetical protein
MIRIDFKEIRWDDTEWILLAPVIDHGNEFSGSIK